jgi:two-component system, NtrC family, sensor kinase
MARLAQLKFGIAGKLAVYLVLGTGAIFMAFGAWNLRAHRAQAEALLAQTAANTTDVIQRSTRYDMLRNDREALQQIVADIGRQSGIRRVRIYNRQGEISFSSRPEERATTDSGVGSIDHPIARIVLDSDGDRDLEMVRPILNQAGCSSGACHEHPRTQRVLGAIDTHVSLAAIDRELRSQQDRLAQFTLLALVLISAASGLFVFLVVHRPVTQLKNGTLQVAGGDLSYRLPAQSKDELGALAISFNHMTEELDKAHRELVERTQNSLIQSEKMASLGRLAATVAHELNNPLFGVVTYARLALKQIRRCALPLEDKESLSEKLAVIERESRRSGEIVKNLLTFARKAPHKVAEQDVNVLIGRAVAVVKHRLALQQVTVETILDPNLPKITCDEGQIQQVLLVLLVNAADAMPDGGALRISSEVRADGAEVAVAVRDTGAGIPRDAMHHIFEPFFTTKADSQGSGLGLAIAHGIVAQHGGEIAVKSEAGRGTEFTIALPVKREETTEAGEEVCVEQG